MNYYEILEVSVNASKEVIKNAYRALTKKYHPDSFVGDKNYAQNKMKEINIAYETLIDDEKRLIYDYANNIRINPNTSVEDVDNYVNNEFVDKKEKVVEKNDENSKKLIIIGIICIIVLFFVAFGIGSLISNINEEKQENQGNNTYIKYNENNVNNDIEDHKIDDTKNEYNSSDYKVDVTTNVKEEDKNVEIEDKKESISVEDNNGDGENEVINGES